MLMMGLNLTAKPSLSKYRSQEPALQLSNRKHTPIMKLLDTSCYTYTSIYTCIRTLHYGGFIALTMGSQTYSVIARCLRSNKATDTGARQLAATLFARRPIE